ncbi:MAG: hypothetical protein HFJ65_08380 [Eggerthellaceae bacterium]|nr:hypothetical protein [Eggerthellaceae bacterium]
MDSKTRATDVASKALKYVLIAEMCVIGFLILVTFVPMIFGFRPTVVLSDTMRPAMPAGAMAYVNQHTAEADYREGDVVAFDIDIPDIDWCGWRIQEIDHKQKMITTTKDAPEIEDVRTNAISDVQGRIDAAVPVLGYAVDTAARNAIWIVIVVGGTAIAAYAVGFYARRRVGDRQQTGVSTQAPVQGTQAMTMRKEGI